MILPIGWAGPASGLLLGGSFGYILQRGGLGDGCKLTGQLRLEDWTVFNVMFTAIIVAAGGLWILNATGLLPASATYTPAALLWPALIGGACVGLGMAAGGYCPGTSVVAATAGRVDGLFFFAGLLGGTLMFAGAYDRVGPWLESIAPLQASTLPELTGIPAWAVILLLAAVAIAVHLILTRTGRRAGHS